MTRPELSGAEVPGAEVSGAPAFGRPSRRYRTCAARASLAVALCLGAMTGAGVAHAAPAQVLPLPAEDPFYSFDGPLTAVAPGTVLRTRDVPYGSPEHTTPIVGTQVLYRSTDQHGDPTATVATVLRPLMPGPARVISYHMAYDALGSQCAPSYTLTGNGDYSPVARTEQDVITGYLAAGYTVVVPDYEGPDLEWTVGRQSGYTALDGVRAAANVLALPETTPVGLVGYSGGSVPTEWGAEVAPQYAPELNIVGAAGGGLPVDLAHNLPYVSGSANWAGVIPALIVAYQRAYGLDTGAFLSERGARIVDEVSGECIGDFAAHYPGLTDADMVIAPYTSLLDVPEVVAAIDDNIMGGTGTPNVPLLLAVGDVDGTGDGVMITRDVEGLARTYCDRGVDITYRQYGGLSHGEAFAPFQAEAARFFTERFAGAAPGNDCAVVGPGTASPPQTVR